MQGGILLYIVVGYGQGWICYVEIFWSWVGFVCAFGSGVRYFFDHEFDAFGFSSVGFGLLSGGSGLAEQSAVDPEGNARAGGDYWDDALSDAACALYGGALGNDDSGRSGSRGCLLPLSI